MPNGHGGVPFLGAPIVLSIMFTVFAVLPYKERFGWVWVAVCLLLAALVGWRLAYHLHMWNADEYGGAYSPPEVYRRVTRRYRLLAVVYACLTTTLGLGILWWLGLP